jgi:hypothetical protein
MSLLSRTALTLLTIHALLNIAQGVYCIVRPRAWTSLVPSAFKGTPDAAVQAIGTHHPSRVLAVHRYTADDALTNNTLTPSQVLAPWASGGTSSSSPGAATGR